MEELTNEEIVLAGLDGRSRRTNRQQIVKNEIGASKFRRHFLERVHLLPKQVQKSLQTHRAQVSSSPYYASAEIKGTRAELIKLANPEEVGITNIDNGKLGKDKHLTLSGIVLRYDATDIKGAYTDRFPTELLNGEWELELHGRKVFEKMPVVEFFDGFYGYDVSKPFGLYELPHPKQIEPQTPIEFNLNLPDALTGFLKVYLKGTVVYPF